jgi:hypothetical protein
MKISKSQKKIPWKSIKQILVQRDRQALINLIEELYSLNSENQTFILTRYGLIDTLEPYKAIIRECVSPEWNRPIQLAEARKAFNRYKKAVGEAEGMLELAVYYVECGTGFTLEYGDIDERFYDSLVSMLNLALKILNTVEPQIKGEYRPRFKALMDKGYGEIGWGYGDYLADAFYEAFDSDEGK